MCMYLRYSEGTKGEGLGVGRKEQGIKLFCLVKGERGFHSDRIDGNKLCMLPSYLPLEWGQGRSGGYRHEDDL